MSRNIIILFKGWYAIKTYQDLLALGENETERMSFIIAAINEHKTSEMCKVALDAQEYAKHKNTTITNYQKLLYTITGQAVPDNYTANHKCVSNFFDYFITQENQYLLGNGVTFTDDKTKDKLGKDFDTKVQQAGEAALVDGVSFGFFNLDHVEIFRLIDKDRGFVPLYDEENGALSAGIRYWQLDENKPLRVTLFELDGYTDYMREKGKEMAIKTPKRAYKLTIAKSQIDGERVYDSENYPTFPIVPLYGNTYHQSEIVGCKSNIDAYDLIKSGFANDLDDASMIYWTLENCGGMDDLDIVKFVERMKTIKAAVVDGNDGSRAEAHTIEVPYQSRETYLTRLRSDLFADFMALDVAQIQGGQTTATQIQAAYEPLNNKVDKYEYQVTTFIMGILQLAGIEDTPSYKRSKIVNQLEETQMVLTAATYLDDETILNKLPFLSDDEVQEILDRKAAEDINRFAADVERGIEAQEAQQAEQLEQEEQGVELNANS